MPRTTTLEHPGCPPIRVLTFDTLGFIKVVESHAERSVPQVVERWGDPGASNSVLAVSIDDGRNDPLLAVARKCCKVEFLNPVSGNVLASLQCGDEDGINSDTVIVGLHLFKKHDSSGVRKFLTCTAKRDASLRTIDVKESMDEIKESKNSVSWKVCGSGILECCKVDMSENYALFGGKGIELNLWDLENPNKIWCAKSPPKNNLGIFTPTWFTCASFLSTNDHRKFVAGTSNHQVRLYDMSSQRRPVMSFDFRENPIKAIANDKDEHTIYVGNVSGDLAAFDIRTGKLLGCFSGKCCGSIRSIVRHPELNVLASCGLDSYLRLWDINTRQPLSAVFLKQHLTNAVFDSNFVPKTATEKGNDNSIHDEGAEEIPGRSIEEPEGKQCKKRKHKQMRK